MGKCEKLKWNRRKLGMTQTELAKKIGVSQTTICRLESDETAWGVMRDQTSDATFDILNKLGSWQCNLSAIFDGYEQAESGDGDMKLMINFREKLKEKRAALSLTQAGLSNLLGISVPTISRYESKPEALENPSAEVYSKLLAFINGQYDNTVVTPVIQDTTTETDVIKTVPIPDPEPEITIEEGNSKEVLCELIDILNKKISKTEDSKVYANMIIGLCNGYLKEA